MLTSLRVSRDTLTRLRRLAGRMQAETGRSVTYEEAISLLLDEKGVSKAAASYDEADNAL